MSALVEALLQLARTSGGVKRAPVAWMARLDGPAQRWAARAEVKVVFSGPDELAAQVDPDALEIAIGSNAIAYSPPGGAVTLHVHAERQRIAVTVDDQGPGIPVGERERVFAPFVHATAPTADRTQGRAGLGLGLAIARRIVEAHAGTLSVGEAPGGGARFASRLTRSSDPGFTVS
ncbi:Histidine kinase-, DNA gyrase B-, and HSP90-like ATPase [Nannocystis exedens]|uniref:histidine kinase n=1 Tax=Nannocystis exedens TaxID=54 RepID=A0A1I1WJT4_9BACT|nr:sensor histidine kinase [Nannocystis exedens]PCC67667.1 two-component sensor histidine kinase [Nannocystis exedens]SFD93693.1 Histidine kinase-, DNA gyrase B-, and HSP90-like ATPase [Nannocystis exedens]